MVLVQRAQVPPRPVVPARASEPRAFQPVRWPHPPTTAVQAPASEARPLAAGRARARAREVLAAAQLQVQLSPAQTVPPRAEPVDYPAYPGTGCGPPLHPRQPAAEVLVPAEALVRQQGAAQSRASAHCSVEEYPKATQQRRSASDRKQERRPNQRHPRTVEALLVRLQAVHPSPPPRGRQVGMKAAPPNPQHRPDWARQERAVRPNLRRPPAKARARMAERTTASHRRTPTRYSLRQGRDPLAVHSPGCGPRNRDGRLPRQRCRRHPRGRCWSPRHHLNSPIAPVQQGSHPARSVQQERCKGRFGCGRRASDCAARLSVLAAH